MLIRTFFKKINTLCCFVGIFLYLNVFFLSALKAQSTHSVSDSLLLQPLNNVKTGVGFTINWDARSSFIKDKRVNIWGVNSGIVFGKKRSQITVGYYWLNFNSYLRLLDFRRNASKLVNLDYYTKTDLYFFSMMYWKNFIENRRWRVSMPIEIGIGATKNQGTDLLTEIQIWKRKDFFLPVQTGIYTKWKATRWIGISVQGGYRYSFVAKNIQENYDGFYYSLGFSLQPDLFKDIYRWAFKKNRANGEHEHYPDN